MKIVSVIQAMSLSAFFMVSCTSTETNSTGNDTGTTTEVSDSKPTSVMPTLAALQADPDVLWLGEAEVDYALNYNRWDYEPKAKERILMENLGFKSRNAFKVLKYQVEDFNTSRNEDHNLFYKIMKNRKDMKFYKDGNLEKECTSKEVEDEIGRVDTIVVLNPTTRMEETQVVVNQLDFDDVKAFRLRQVIYYSKKAMAFKSIALAAAPLVYDIDSETPTPADLRPLFWMEVTALNKASNLDVSNIKWAKRLYRNFDLSTVNIIKADQSISAIIDIMMNDFKANAATTKIANTFDADGISYLSAEEIQHLGSSIDTIITFDPKTFKEFKQVVENKVDGKNIKNLRLIQDWVWDDNSNSLSIRYVGFAPIINRVDNQGAFLNSGPLLIRKVEDIQ